MARPFSYPGLTGRSRKVFWWLIAAFALLSAAAGTALLLPFDQLALRTVRMLPLGPFDHVGAFFSTLGSLEVSTVLFGVLVVAVFLRGDRRPATRLVVAFAATAAIEVTMKLFLPVPPIPEGIVRRSDFSPFLDAGFPYPYPSGHMLRTTMLLGALCLLWQNNRLLWTFSALLLLGMGASRVYLGVHWASDVIGGTLLGAAGLAWAFGESISRSARYRKTDGLND